MKKLQPDLVLLDLHLPDLDGFTVIRLIRERAPAALVLLLSSHCDDYSVFRAEGARVQGFVDKNTNTVEALKAAITAVVAGHLNFSPAFDRMSRQRRANSTSFDRILA